MALTGTFIVRFLEWGIARTIAQILKYAQGPLITNMHGVALATGPLIAKFL
jgi:hypothetical protein